RKQDPWDANNDGFSEIGKNQAGAFGLRGFLNIGSNNKLTLELHYINEERRGGDNFSLQPHESNICEMAKHNITGLALSWKHFSKDNKGYLNLYSSTQYTDRNSYYGAEKNPDAYGKTSDFILVNGLQYTRNHNLLFTPGTLTIGAEQNFNELKDAMPGYHRSIDQEVIIIGAFAQNEWKTEHMTILAGIRADKHNLLDNVIISPRLTFKYDFDNILQTRMSFGTGYRAPQAYDEDL
ncbi:MAG TPA: TonB-dependent receptor, partial [Bacteroidales bacterium]|nr:TonB-dependent receptor [Bacteroidales bacterium]